MNTINWQRCEGYGILTIQRPHVLNALNSAVFEQMQTVFSQAQKEQLSAVIITGAADKAFAAGADIAALASMDEKQLKEFSLLGKKTFELISSSPCVTIAAINGYALGGGLELAMACDLIYAAENALLGLPEIKLGLIPGFDGIDRLIAAVGLRAAKEMLLTGAKITAQQALELKLINAIIAKEELLNFSEKRARSFADSPLAILSLKKIFSSKIQKVADHSSLELELFAECFASDYAKAKLNTFTKKSVSS